MKRIAINGFGRIGRAFLRATFGDNDFDIVAVNDPFFTAEMARYLLLNDSVYGRFPHDVTFEDDALIIDGKRIRLLAEREPDQLPWGEETIDLAVEATGVFRAYSGAKGAARHVEAGAKRVLLTVPSKGENADKIPQIVYGVNHGSIDAGADVVSAASCTTNSVVPVISVLENEIGIAHAFLTTIHGYTADQQLVDGMHSSMTRSRAAAVNIIPTTTGAASATAKVLPSLAGKMDGIAMRVPVPTGSVSDLTIELVTAATADELNDIFRRHAERDLKDVLGISDDPIVSSDIIGDTHPSIVDLSATHVVDGRFAKVMAFYDNEWGYTNQLVRLARIL